MLSSCSLFALLYKTAMVPSGLIKTPQSALWPIQNTTERFVAYSKHHRALCGLFETPQSALWLIRNTTERFVVFYSGI